jgi:hypothetical protein
VLDQLPDGAHDLTKAAAGLCARAGCGILTYTQKLVATVHAIADHRWLAGLAASTVASWSVTVHLCSTGVVSCKSDAPLDSPEVLRPPTCLECASGKLWQQEAQDLVRRSWLRSLLRRESGFSAFDPLQTSSKVLPGVVRADIIVETKAQCHRVTVCRVTGD